MDDSMLMGAGSMILKLVLDKLTPDLIWLPDGAEVQFGFGWRDALPQYPVEKDESGNALVGGAMDEDGPVAENFEHTTKGPEILGSGALKSTGIWT